MVDSVYLSPAMCTITLKEEDVRMMLHELIKYHGDIMKKIEAISSSDVRSTKVKRSYRYYQKELMRVAFAVESMQEDMHRVWGHNGY